MEMVGDTEINATSIFDGIFYGVDHVAEHDFGSGLGQSCLVVNFLCQTIEGEWVGELTATDVLGFFLFAEADGGLGVGDVETHCCRCFL